MLVSTFFLIPKLFILMVIFLEETTFPCDSERALSVMLFGCTTTQGDQSEYFIPLDTVIGSSDRHKLKVSQSEFLGEVNVTREGKRSLFFSQLSLVLHSN